MVTALRSTPCVRLDPALMIARPSLVRWLIQNAPGLTLGEVWLPRNISFSIRLACSCDSAERGLYAVVAIAPSIKAPNTAGETNCQADTPAARATTSSLRREKFR